MTKFLIIATLLFFVSCNQNNSSKSNNDSMISLQEKDTVSNKERGHILRNSIVSNDTALISLSNSILNLIKNKQYAKFSEFIHPTLEIRFSPYGIADTIKNQKLSVKQFLKLNENKKVINWGVFEGTGEPINFNLDNYFKRFVYDADFIHAKKKSVNKIIGSDSSSSNVTVIYPGCDFVQFYFPGFNKKYDGMDWKSLVLVFTKKNSKQLLIAIIHDQWKS